ncbi:hypothetical protein AXE80_08080 [Wenyingzhuangia fucanilytica]|uniref:Secretion system C-terminal sorting domain-containing protein n=1 Tax=Wenyingzhuangia fucanilytica TaxID=1790137 RepID=A0A1B1Y675_9FLAO|nr:T9SS type A sorting domain-containing protein [Wenyingzhuangia fucanilytica]ANW96238.1 hypothetical protein AXE80_08080 [Wenyingzhuangia fucanilytica]
MKKVLKIIGFWLITGCLQLCAQNSGANIFDEEYYGFEVTGTDTGWWMQHPENFSIVSDKGSNGSSHSLKYTSSEIITGNKKAHGSSDTAMKIDLVKGTYTMNAMVWLAVDAEISALKMVVKPLFVNAVFDLSGLPKEQWVAVETTLVLDEAIVDGNLLVQVDTSAGGKGEMYIDDIELHTLLDQQQIPFISEINTIVENGVTLDAGTYEISLKVWVDNSTTLKSFYTYITEPWIASYWDLNGLQKGEWVSLKNEFTIDEPADNSEFRISVNNDPSYGGGKGAFYLDDIHIEPKESLSIDENHSRVGNNMVYPNPANEKVYFNLQDLASVVVYNSLGVVVHKIDKADASTVLDVSSFTRGIYPVKITSKGNVYLKKLIID